MSTAVELKPIKSSMFSHVGYSDDSWVLSVVFKSTGLRLDYQNISPELNDEMMAAESIGKYFNANIKGKFQAIGDEVARQAGDPPLELTDIDRDIQMVSPGWDGEKVVPVSDDGIPADAPVPPHIWPTYGGIDRSQVDRVDYYCQNSDGTYSEIKGGIDFASGSDSTVETTVEQVQSGKIVDGELQPFGPDDVFNEVSFKDMTSLATQPKPEILAAWTAPKTPIEALTMLQDRQGEIDAMVRANTSEGQAALQLRVTDAISHQEAGVELASLVKTKDRTFGLLDPIRAILYRTYEMAGDQQKKALGPLDVAIQHVKRAMGAWEQAQEQLRMQRVRLEREKAEAAARELQQQQSAQLTLAEVGDALEQGDTAKAEDLIANPISVPLPYVAPAQVEPTYLPPAGQSTRANWKVDEETVNLAEFLTAIKAGKYPIEKAVKLLKPDLPALNKMAKALESAFDVPGFVAVNEPIRSVRRQKML